MRISDWSSDVCSSDLTKAALLAAILQNLADAPIIGVHVPKHYLLGIAATPQPGQATLRYRGTRYVLVEAAGPGKRPPGDIATSTQTALNDMSGVRIDQIGRASCRERGCQYA